LICDERLSAPRSALTEGVVMDCFECAVKGAAVAAVATCQHCGVGLCLDHLREAHNYTVAGTRFGCPHDLTAELAAGKQVLTGDATTGQVHHLFARAVGQ
jgi:hypothetical protein